MTTTQTVEVPEGKKMRAPRFCPRWCVASDADHAAAGDRAHHGPVRDLADGAFMAHLSSGDDGATVEITLSVTIGRDTTMSAATAQSFLDDLQLIVDVAKGTQPTWATPARRPSTRREVVARALLLRAEPHPATPAGAALEVLTGTRQPEDFVPDSVLVELESLDVKILALMGDASSLDPDPDPDQSAQILGQMVDLERRRRQLLLEALEKPA